MLTTKDKQTMEDAGWVLRETYDDETGKFSLQLYSTRGAKSPRALLTEITHAAKAGNSLSQRVLQTIMKSYL